MHSLDFTLSNHYTLYEVSSSMRKEISNFPECRIKNVIVMRYTSSKKITVHVEGRKQSTFMHVMRGQYHYISDDVDFLVCGGDTVYVPQFADYVYMVESVDSECLQVEFDLETERDGKVVPFLLSDAPFVRKGDGAKHESVFKNMLNNYYGNIFGVLTSTYALLAEFDAEKNRESATKSGEYRIFPAVDFINKNFKSQIYTSELAKICGFSEPHLRRLFKEYLGVSPTEYRNSLLSSAARDMLMRSDLNVSDVSYELNFPDIYSFSRFFKKQNGMSPKNFIDKYRK